MSLFKNLYVDLGFLNPKKYLKKKQEQDSFKESQNYTNQVPQSSPIPDSAEKEFPYVPRKLLERDFSKITPPSEIPSELPRLTKEFFSEHKSSAPSVSTTAIPVNPKEKPVVQRPPKFLSDIEKIGKETDAETGTKTDDSDILFSDTTFFNKLNSSIKNQENIIHSVSSRDIIFNDLFNEMKEFWENKHYNYKRQIEYKEIEEDLTDRITDLHNLEIEWQKNQLAYDKIKDNLHKKELEIESKITELKKLFKKYHVELYVRPEYYFKLCNGKRIKSIIELKNLLPEIPDEVFDFHVNDEKNDFSLWIKNVIGLNDLAEELDNIKDKKAFFNIIRDYCK
ncbi:hypothetical protein JXB41_02160 [Candidatus Woesearchaeota archaeon]|nr:hypothetical protein [Candidatus Woesearchaeota archaeon]